MPPLPQSGQLSIQVSGDALNELKSRSAQQVVLQRNRHTQRLRLRCAGISQSPESSTPSSLLQTS